MGENKEKKKEKNFERMRGGGDIKTRRVGGGKGEEEGREGGKVRGRGGRKIKG